MSAIDVRLEDEVTVVRAYRDRLLLGYVCIGRRGGWEVHYFHNGNLHRSRDMFGSKAHATAELVRRIERTTNRKAKA